MYTFLRCLPIIRHRQQILYRTAASYTYIIGNEWWGAMKPYPYRHRIRLYQHVFSMCVFYDGFLQLGHFFAFGLYVSNTHMNLAECIPSPSNSKYCAGIVRPYMPCYWNGVSHNCSFRFETKTYRRANNAERRTYTYIGDWRRVINTWIFGIFSRSASRFFVWWFMLFTTCL